MREVPARLAAELHLLSEALHDPAQPLEEHLVQLHKAMGVAVASYLGLSVTMISDGQPFAFTSMVADADSDAEPDLASDSPASSVGRIATSVRLPLTAFDGAEPGSVVVFYAARAGAFVDFAADARFALSLPPGGVVLDANRTPTGEPAELVQLSVVNVALGLLIGGGRTPEDAHRELQRLADEAGTGLAVAAATMVRRFEQEHGGEGGR